MHFGRHRIIERQLLARAFEPRLDDRPRVATPPLFGEIGNDAGLADKPHCAHREKLRVPRSDADTVQRAGDDGHPPVQHGLRVADVHSRSLASALMAAAVMALPPLRPRMVTNGTRPSAINASF